ncbi:MAG: AAA family ATPase [Christensenellales bacterium]|jgi:MoxR-like ATPase
MDAREKLRDIGENMARVMVGKEPVIELALTCLLCRGHLLIEDVPGIGKTTLAASLARSLGCSFHRIQFTPDVMPSDITGFNAVNVATGEFTYHPGAVMSQLVLADEINRTSPKTQSSLLEAMQENQVTVDQVTYALPQPFMVMATQNPVDYIGTYPLPEAQMDRFFMRLSIGYPSWEEELGILERFENNLDPLDALRPVASAEDILALQGQLDQVACQGPVKEYIVRIVTRTREHEDLALGVSPRGAIALMRAAKGWALLHGRDYTLPDDVQQMLLPVLSHRVVLKPEARLKEMTAERVLKGVVNSLQVPGIR